MAQALSRDSLIWNETRDLAGNLGDFAYSSCSFINNLELLAVDAVQSKPLSGPNSLLSGIITGIFASFATLMTCHDPSILFNPDRLSHHPQV